MKRWQDRGEVGDSEEDEDLSLDAYTPSPERPHKRAKIAQSDSIAEDGTDVPLVGASDSEDESQWIQAKAAKTYGRKGRSVKQALAPKSHPQTPVKGVEFATPHANLVFQEQVAVDNLESENVSKQPTCTRHDADTASENPDLYPGLLSTVGDDLFALSEVQAVETHSAGNISTICAPSPIKEIVQPQFSTSVLLKRSFGPNVPEEVSSNDEQTSASHLVAHLELLGQLPKDPLAPVLPGPQDNDFTHLSDLSSSPLSERDISPPPGFGNDKTDILISLGDPADASSGSSSPPQNADDTEAARPIWDANARRSLRARKEKQLHPYMYDKAQYQKQFRERGLKPVRVVEQATRQEESQSESHSAASQSSTASSMSAAPVSQTPQRPRTASHQLSYFDAAGGSSDDELGQHQPLPKRKSFGASHDERPGRLPARKYGARPTGHNEYAVPPSPPRTSSDNETLHISAETSRQAVDGLRLPLGRDSTLPPTPQISSDARSRNTASGSSRNVPRMLNVQRRASETLSPELSSSESEEAEEEETREQAEATRLRREQKRIKGVLPASWLRIDFRKQRVQRPPPPISRRRLSVEPWLSSELPKGVARKIIGTRRRRDVSPELHAFGAEQTDDSDGSTGKHSAEPEQKRLDIPIVHSSLYSNEAAVDIENMEDDFVDPMLAGKPRSERKRGPNQPRITDAFRKTTELRPEFADDRVSRKRAARGSAAHGPQRQKRRALTLSRPSHVHLSIVDAPIASSDTRTVLPQFLRLALRRAQHEPSHGRHSPSGKVLRLTTADDTEEASSILRAWRAGTIEPRRLQDSARGGFQLPPATIPDDQRVMLSDISANGDQRSMRRTDRRPLASASYSRRRPKEAVQRTHGANVIPSSRQRRTPQNPRLRTVQMETLESEFDQMHRSLAFERRMQVLTESTALPDRPSRAQGFQLSRYLHADATVMPNDSMQQSITRPPEQTVAKIPHRPRKSVARRLDTSSRQYRQPSEPLPDLTIDVEHMQTSAAGDSEPVLEGLGTFGTRYPIDFDMKPLGLGTFFQHTTLIGSGELADALSLTKRDLSREAGHMRVQMDGKMLEWGAWNEDVAANFTRIPQAIGDALQTLAPEAQDVTLSREQQLSAVDSNIEYLLRSVVRFCSKCVYFIDAVDRHSCAESLHRLVVDLADSFAAPATPADTHPTKVKVFQYQLVIAKQASQISDHHIVPVAVKTELDIFLSRTSKRLVNDAVVGHFTELRALYEDSRHADRLEAGIDGNAHVISSILILNNILPDGGSKSLLWTAICSNLNTQITEMRAVGKFERLWYDLFSLLPVLELTAAGTLRAGSRFVQSQEDWTVPQALLSRAFQLYESSSDVRGYSVNEYMRALLSRCHTLVSKWGWWRCESVLNLIYDFFSHRGLALLKKEDGRGSPEFLDDLGSGHVDLELHPGDCSFHIFLKILGSGLLGMSKHHLYGARKIQGIACRFIPNHNRSCRKDVDVARSTLDALRNHHDLMSTLYFACPPGYRPSVRSLQQLVDHSTSHREACRLNFRSWANITSFQASTTEGLEVLQPLNTWFDDMMRTTVAQYRLASSEAQEAFDQAKAEGADPSKDLLESAVAKNQSQIAATLVDALAGLKRALKSASSSVTVACLVQGTSFWTVFELFGPSQKRLVGVMTEALHVVEAILDADRQSKSIMESQQSSSDSQDFGDSDALQEFAANEQNSPDSLSIVETLLEPIGHFLSNVFGADVAPEDSLLQKVIDVWVRLANVTVQKKKKSWLNYVDEYSITGWGQLRDTAQKRKFTAYFMSHVAEQSSLELEFVAHVLSAWLLSLVEREALLKFQHTLTSALLNHFGRNPLLQNLPFAKDSRGTVNITLSELRQSRLALISSVLCNMREDYERAKRLRTAQDVRSSYEKMLQLLMQAMKSNYQELQMHRDVADASVQGAYVEFVQHVVSFLQQHATGICVIDSFFTDSTVFPLPSGDPTYVVGRLKGYVPELHKQQTRMKLAAFVQSVGERAAVDGQQPYLVKQMAAAMTGVSEQGDKTSPSLRHVLLTAVFPAYIENAFASACSWILAVPILQACEQIIPDLLYGVQIEDESSVTAAGQSAGAVLHEIIRQFANILGGFPGLIGFPHVLRTLSAMLRVGTSCLTLASFIKRFTSQGEQLIKHIQALFKLCVGIGDRVGGPSGGKTFEASVVVETPTSIWPDTRSYAATHLRDDMNPYWCAESGRYYLKRYNRIQEAVVPLGDSEQERLRLLRAMADFERAHEAIFNVRGRTRRQDTSDDRLMENVIV